MKEYEFKDLNGNVLIKGELPDGFKTQAFMEVKQYPKNQTVYARQCSSVSAPLMYLHLMTRGSPNSGVNA